MIFLSRGPTAYRIVVDEEDAWVANFDWWVNARGYPYRPAKQDGRRTSLTLSREICGLKVGDDRVVDHINGDKLDNRRKNLRVCTKTQNRHNQQAHPRTKFRGVYQRKHSGKWYAIVQIDGVRNNLGTFDTEEEAAAVASEFRRLNMPFSHMDVS